MLKLVLTDQKSDAKSPFLKRRNILPLYFISYRLDDPKPVCLSPDAEETPTDFPPRGQTETLEII